MAETFYCQNCGDEIYDCDLTEILLCPRCEDLMELIIVWEKHWTKGGEAVNKNG